jgi:hypothetical protein
MELSNSLTKLIARLSHIKFFPLVKMTLLLLLLLSSHLLACNETITGNKLLIGNFSESRLANWQPIEFAGHTEYKITNVGNTAVLRAQSDNSASGIICKQRIDLRQTPILKWRWRVDKALSSTNEQQRDGDDFAARLYVVVNGGLFFWKTMALNYVWSNQIPANELWENPYAGSSTMMLALRSKHSPLKTWFSESRNVYEDLERAFGHPIRYIDAVAVMSDTDNTASKALTFYGDIYFTTP